MSNCFFGTRNWIVTGTVSASAEVDGLDAGQVQTPHGSTATAWQTPVGTTTAWLQLDAGAAVEWGAVSLHNTNLTAGAEIRIRIGEDSAFASAEYDSGTLTAQVAEGYRQAVHILPTTQNARYLRIDITDAANPESVIRVAQAFAGPIVRATYNFGYATAYQRSAVAPAIETRGGQEFPDYRYTRRAWSISLPAVLPAEAWTVVGELQRAAEAGGNVLFVPLPSSSYVNREAVFGRLVSAGAVTWPYASPQLRGWSVTISERL